MYTRIIGRPWLYDRLNQALKSSTPAWFQPVARALLRVPRSLHAKLLWQSGLRTLPRPLRSRFDSLYVAARRRWDARESGATGSAVELPLVGGPYVVTVRPGTTDILAYADIVLRGQYATPIPWDVQTIVDAGANIGIASAFFMNRYPTARVIAIEPDPVNAALCRRNLEQFGSRCEVLEAAFTPTPTHVHLAPDLRGTWAAHVVEATAGAIEGVDLPTLLQRFKLTHVDILKIDIEGGERQLFEHPDRTWIELVRAFMVELESDASERAFFAALASPPFRFARSGEITSAIRWRPH